jgi:CDP-glucose 4,6-dehydratase
MAAQALVQPSYADPLGTYATNVMGTARVLQAVRAVPSVRAVIVVSSDKVYANDGTGRPFAEDDRLGGHDPHSSSKACAELVTDSFRQCFPDDLPQCDGAGRQCHRRR